MSLVIQNLDLMAELSRKNNIAILRGYLAKAILVMVSCSQVRSIPTNLLLVTCNPVLPAAWMGGRRLNRLPRQLFAGEEGGMTPSRSKYKTCQRADKLT